MFKREKRKNTRDTQNVEEHCEPKLELIYLINYTHKLNTEYFNAG